MDRVNGANTIDIGGGRRGFRNEDLPSGSPGTEVTALFMNMVQEELLAVIEGAGMVANDQDWTQFLKALRIFSVRRTTWMPVISMTDTEPPLAPVQGDAYLIPVGATGAWAGNSGKLADWTGSQWSMITQPNGHGISLPDGRVFIRVANVYVEKLALDMQSGKWSYAAATGSANALAAALAPVPVSLASITGAVITVKTTAAANTAAMTLNLNGLGARSIVHTNGSAMLAGEVPASSILTLVYDGTNFVAFSTTPTIGAATDTAQGIVELATAAETLTGTDGTRAVTPAGLAARTATDTRTGIVELATTAEATTGTDTARAVTPAGVAAAINAAVTALINGSPGALDTLNELAAALGDDANFAATMTTALAGKVDITRVATATVQGIVELATNTEAVTGTDTARATTPAGVAAAIAAAAPGAATATVQGLVELATTAEAQAGTDTVRAVTPAGLKAAIGPGTWQDLTASRAVNTSYQNTTGRAIDVAVYTGAQNAPKTFSVSSNGSTWLDIGFAAIGSGSATTQNLASSGPFTIPPGWYYRVNTADTLTSWMELR